MATYKVRLLAEAENLDVTIDCPDDKFILEAAEDSNIEFLGYQKDVASLYAKSHIICLPSWVHFEMIRESGGSLEEVIWSLFRALEKGKPLRPRARICECIMVFDRFTFLGEVRIPVLGMSQKQRDYRFGDA